MIGKMAFTRYLNYDRSAVSLEKVILHQGLQIIKWGAFEFNIGLTVINLPEGLREIDLMGFSGCNLEKIYIPKSCRIIEAFAFADNKNLLEVRFDSDALIEELDKSAFLNTNIYRIKIRTCGQKVGLCDT